MTKQQFRTEFLKLIINFKTGEGGFAEIGIDPDEDYSVLPRGKESEGTIGRLNYLLGQIGNYRITDSEPHEESRRVIDGPGYIEEYACDYYRTNIPSLLLDKWTSI